MKSLDDESGIKTTEVVYRGPEACACALVQPRWSANMRFLTGATPMRSHYAVALAVVLGIGAGGAAVQVLHAQAKPPVYIVTEIAVSELSGYANEYAPRAQASIVKAGGRILAASFDVIPLEGHPPK